MSRFRSSPGIDMDAYASFETGATLEFNNLLVSFDSEIRSELDMDALRISESGH